MLPCNIDRRGHVPHVILTLIGFEFSWLYSLRKLCIAFNAILSSFRMDSMKLCTNILSSNINQYISFNIKDRSTHSCDAIKVFHQ